ncbi:MAG: two component system sensor kinase [Naasia sp.]|nr:two component system sensor kinase [Naasia sp.]
MPDSRRWNLPAWLHRTVSLAGRVDPVAVALLLATVAAIVLLSVEASIGVRVYRLPLVLAFALATLHAAALPLAVVRPLLATILAAVASLGLQIAGERPEGGPWPWWPAMIVTQSLIVLLVGLTGSWRVAVVGWLAGLVPSATAALLLHPANSDDASTNIVVHVSVTGATLLLGILLGQWQLIRGQLLRERVVSAEEYSRRLLAEDRARIARELHDVVAHSMSMINVQASTARYRHTELDQRSLHEFDEIAASSRQALTEMRSLLGVLRPGDAEGDLAPQPDLDGLADLVEQAQRAGMDVVLERADPVSVSELVGLAGYRIVQEALTNASRHAPAARVVVRCEGISRDVVLTVTNSAAAPVGDGRGTGLGLIGMSERAASVGGTVTAERTPDGGFTVRAVLPLLDGPPHGDRLPAVGDGS